MSFENLSIGRLIIHEVFARGADKALVQPNYGGQLLVLPQDARDALQARITNALGKSSHGVEMSIRESGADSTWHKAKEIVESQGNDAQFVSLSQNFASKLAVAQTNRTKAPVVTRPSPSCALSRQSPMEASPSGKLMGT
jgi:hypothetical protein